MITKREFLMNRDETGREIVTYFETGKSYFIEYFGDARMADWGSYNPSTGKIENKKGAGKFTGAISEEDSLITKENGFEEIVLGNGSPYATIEIMHEKWKKENGY